MLGRPTKLFSPRWLQHSNNDQHPQRIAPVKRSTPAAASKSEGHLDVGYQRTGKKKPWGAVIINSSAAPRDQWDLILILWEWKYKKRKVTSSRGSQAIILSPPPLRSTDHLLTWILHTILLLRLSLGLLSGISSLLWILLIYLAYQFKFKNFNFKSTGTSTLPASWAVLLKA